MIDAVQTELGGLLNIKSLVVPQPEAPVRLPFDPERDISNREWINITDLMKKSSGNIGDFLEMGALVKIISPDRFSGIEQQNIYHDPQSQKAIRESLIWNRHQDKLNPNPAFFIFGSYAKIIDPAFVDEFRDLTDKEWRQSLKTLRIFLSPKFGSKRSYLAQAKHMYEMYPDRFKEKVPLKVFKEILDESKQWQIPYNWHNCAEMLADLKILCPEKVTELGLTPDLWKGLVTDLTRVRDKNNLIALLRTAAQMRLLSANEIKVSDFGLELIFDRSLKEPIQIPQMRRF